MVLGFLVLKIRSQKTKESYLRLPKANIWLCCLNNHPLFYLLIYKLGWIIALP